MRKCLTVAKAFLTDESGATMVEYALMVALIAIIAAVGATTLGSALNTKFGAVAGSV